MRVVLFDWVCGGHHELYLRRFAEALRTHAEVSVAAPDAAFRQLENLPVARLPLGQPRPPIPARAPLDSRRRSVLEEEIRLLERAAHASNADMIVHLYADAVVPHLALRAPLSAPLAILLFYPRAHYGAAFGARLGVVELLRARIQERLISRWRQRSDAHAILTLDEVAARRWGDRRGAPAYWLPEPPVAVGPESRSGAQCGCVIYGALGQRKGIDLVAGAISVAPTPISITIAGETTAAYLPTLQRHVAEMRRGGATVELRNVKHDEVEGLGVLAGARCAILAYEHHYGMSRVLLESCSVGTPVIVHDRGLIGHLVKRYGLGRAVDCRKPREFREAILEMTEDGAREAYAASLESFARRYSAERFEQAVLAPLRALDISVPGARQKLPERRHDVTAHALDGVLVGGIAAALAVPLARRIVRRRFDPFEPFFLFVLAYGVMFVVRPAAMLIDDRFVFVSPDSTLDVSGHFMEMLVLALVGAIAFGVGYELDLGGRLANVRRLRERPIEDHRVIALALVFALIALSSLAAFVALDGSLSLSAIVRADKNAFAGGVENYRYLWLAFYMLVPASLAMLGLGVTRRSKAIVAGALATIALVLLRVVPLGNRIAIMPLIGGAFVLCYLLRGRRPSARSLVLLAIVAVFASSFLSDLRGRATRHENVVQTLQRSSRPSRFLQPFTTGPDSEMAPALAAALSVIPEELPHRYGRTIFEDLVVRPVPRPLWSGKPQPPRDELTAKLWPTEFARGTIQPEFSALLYFYWDFGVVGVLVGMAAYGIGARLLYEFYRLRAHRLSVKVIYALLLWFVVIGLRDSPVDTVMHAFFMVVPAVVIFRFAHRAQRAASRARASAEASVPG